MITKEQIEGWYMITDDYHNIATAPKDGTRFLAYQKGDTIQECWWCEDFPEWTGWQNDWDSEPDPTHWMPLPAPPSLPPHEGEG